MSLKVNKVEKISSTNDSTKKHSKKDEGQAQRFEFQEYLRLLAEQKENNEAEEQEPQALGPSPSELYELSDASVKKLSLTYRQDKNKGR